ncbi:hypothetical protein ACFLW2_02190 [Chloroflexota bacterium]
MLDLKKPVQARELSIALIGAMKKPMANMSVGGKNEARDRREQRLYDFELHLDGEKEYNKGMEYPFEIVIPDDVTNLKPSLPDTGGKLGQGLKLAQSAATMMGAVPRLKWYLKATLDVPKGIDVNDKQDITIQ